MTEIGYEPISALIELTGLSQRTAINLIDTGELRGRKIGGRWFVTREQLRELERESVSE
ncbi:helix-turn-helix domain-containing protein [Gordonia sp. ABSL49_1]|uniref:helix-turn-helix domain-containing protein n=1 Tax=Gordonia sp. ABSL49_1 TaxID=2920941 RepID=UPI0035B0D468